VKTRAELLSEVRASYVSASARATWCARLAPTAAFYARVAPVVLRNAERGRGGYFTSAAWRDAARDIVRAFERGGVPLIVENLEVFDRLEGPCVIIGNHMSTTETFVLAAWLLERRPITYVVKQSLVEYPVFKHIMCSCDPVVVGRKDPRADLKAVLEGGSERLGRGISLVIFPQRTRKVELVPEEFNSIGVKLAKRAGVPVVPLAVKTDAWANGKALKDFGPFQNDRPVHFAFGEPLAITGNGKEQNDAVIRFIGEKLAEWAEWDATWRSAR
jgi:1-acyl-sn-glycerol-3-phosphate acyltransferase